MGTDAYEPYTATKENKTILENRTDSTILSATKRSQLCIVYI